MGKRELIALLNLSSWCLVMVERLFLAVPQGCLQFVIVVFPDHTHLLFLHQERRFVADCLTVFADYKELQFGMLWSVQMLPIWSSFHGKLQLQMLCLNVS